MEFKINETDVIDVNLEDITHLMITNCLLKKKYILEDEEETLKILYDYTKIENEEFLKEIYNKLDKVYINIKVEDIFRNKSNS